MTDNGAEGIDEEGAVSLLRGLGIPDPEDWVRSEMAEGIAQVARAVFLHAIWADLIDSHIRDLGWIDRVIAYDQGHPGRPFADTGAILQRLLAAGADPGDIGRLCRWVAYETAFGVIERVDAGHDPEVQAAPGWVLMETAPDGTQTGRVLGALHESLLELDPSAREGVSEDQVE